MTDDSTDEKITQLKNLFSRDNISEIFRDGVALVLKEHEKNRQKIKDDWFSEKAKTPNGLWTLSEGLGVEVWTYPEVLDFLEGKAALVTRMAASLPYINCPECGSIMYGKWIEGEWKDTKCYACTIKPVAYTCYGCVRYSEPLKACDGCTHGDKYSKEAGS
jgi:hypothetical protein